MGYPQIIERLGKQRAEIEEYVDQHKKDMPIIVLDTLIGRMNQLQDEIDKAQYEWAREAANNIY